MLKRTFDLVFAILAIIILLPVMLLLAVVVRLKLGAPVLFCQMRPGQNCQIFKLIKFRSMINAKDSKGVLMPDDQRLSTFGKILRSTSLDELPSLWNVIKGDMSLIGPRPLLVEYLPLYSKTQLRRHEVRPGITGWAQVNGRNAISWKEKFTLDVWYVDNQSFILDVKILFLTVKKVLFREHISQSDHVTMTAFEGNIEE